MSLSVSRTFLNTPTTVGQTVSVKYRFAGSAVGSPTTLLNAFADLSISGWGTNFTLISGTDVSQPGSSVTGTIANTSTPTQLSFSGPLTFTIQVGVNTAIYEVVYTFVASVSGGPFGAAWSNGANFTVSLSSNWGVNGGLSTSNTITIGPPSVVCTRTFSSNSIPAGQTFQINYRFDNQTSSPAFIQTFSDNTWAPGGNQILQVPVVGLGLNFQTFGVWLAVPYPGVGNGAFYFAFDPIALPRPEIGPGDTAYVTIDVYGIDLGLVNGSDFNSSNVQFVEQNGLPVFLNSNSVDIIAMICVAKGTLVALADGSKLPIEQLRAGQLLLDQAGRPVRLSAAIRVEQPTTSLIQLEQGSLGRDVPSVPLRIRPGHPLLIAGNEILPENLLHLPGVAQVQLEKPVHVYTLLTEQRSFVDMQGAFVGTWSEAAWQNFVDNDEHSAHLRWKFV